MNSNNPSTRFGLETCEDMYEKLRWEAARLEEEWGVYDTFNFDCYSRTSSGLLPMVAIRSRRCFLSSLSTVGFARQRRRRAKRAHKV